VSLDGASASRARLGSEHVDAQLELFMHAVSRVCERLNCVVLKRAVDVPNLHRMREVGNIVAPASGVGHARHFSEMGLEGANQPLKIAISRGNG